VASNGSRPVPWAEFKKELAKFKAELAALEKRLNEKFNRLAAHVVQNTEDIKDIRATMATKDDINRIVTILDSMMVTYNACWNKSPSR